jgi:hypothetical protein
LPVNWGDHPVAALKRWPFELLFHALALGPMVYAGYWLVADHAPARERIVIDGGQVADIRAQFRAHWSRNPTDDELRGLVEAVAHEEILNRESDELGLGRDDPDRQRLVLEKYEALADEWLAARPPTDEELEDWLAVHAADYSPPGSVSFSQLLLVAAGTIGDAAASAQRLRLRLDRGVRVARLGLPTELPPRAFRVRLDEVERDYGPNFADSVARLPVGLWLGPIESRHGAHLVRVEEIRPGSPPPLAEVREQVLRDFESSRRQRALDAAMMAMRWKYEVVVEPALARQASR